MTAGDGSHRVRTRAPRPPVRMPEILRSPDDLEPYLSDAAHFPGGHAACLALPRTEGEIAALVRAAPRLLVVGAQSSLTGGATPMGEWLASTNRMTDIEHPAADRVRVQAGVPLLTLQQELAARHRHYPASTTFSGALLGGTVATNAAGPGTFKYGSTRDWVRSVRVVLAGGEVLELRRGEARAHPDGYFEIETGDRGIVRVPLPDYRMPAVRKRSAGYHSEPGMDLVDLFIGSEGTLGILAEVELEVLAVDFQLLTGILGCRSERTALEVAGELREVSIRTRRSASRGGLDLPAIEMADGSSLELLRQAGEVDTRGLRLSPAWECVLFFEVELPVDTDAAAAADQIASYTPEGPHRTALETLCAILDRQGLLEDLQVALPGETERADQIRSLREAVPIAVNHRIGAVRRERGEAVQKVAADMIVPFEAVGEALEIYREGFNRRGLEFAIWGHLSDGNLHPNVLPGCLEDVARGEEAVLEFGARIARMGGCPLSEHGVGRSRVKQELLRRLYGDAGIEAMRRVKRALDPGGVLAPGVLFPAVGANR